MLRYFMVLVCALAFNAAQAQQNPVSWTFSAKKIKKGEYKLSFTAKIQTGWAIYSQFLNEGGPVPTSFAFDKNDAVQLVDKIEETSEHKIEGIDEIFEMQIVKYKEEVVFSQVAKVSASTQLKGSVTFMSCDSETCLPPRDVPFEFSLKK